MRPFAICAVRRTVLVAPGWLRAYALPLPVIGLAVHGARMTLKYRFESRDSPPVW
jgi:hypothetical protein